MLSFALLPLKAPRVPALDRRRPFALSQCILASIGLFVSLATATAQTAIQADKFVDSAGINVHLHYTDTLYATNFSLIQTSLRQLGVRHLRDGIALDAWRTYDNELNLLGQYGIKGIFIAGPKQTAAEIQTFQSLVPQSFEGVENPNEYDNAGVSNWYSVLQSEAPVVHDSVAGQNPMPMIIGPSLVKPTSYATLSTLALSLTHGNIHNYHSWKNPGTPGSYGWGYGNYLSNAWALSMEAITAPALPVIATESGYTNATNCSNYVPESVAAVYMPRLLLEQFRSGIKRTYIYELLSTTGEDFGLLRVDGSKKPAFTAVANLLNLLSDPGASFTPDTLPIVITGANSTLHTVLFEKRDKTFYLAIWIELPRYDGTAGPPGKSITVTPVPVTIALPNAIQSASLYKWSTAVTVSTTNLAASQTQNFNVTDQLAVLAFVQK